MPITPAGRYHRRGFAISSGLTNGFTLVELLVVIGIIAILVGLLMPVFAKVRQAAYVADTQQEMATIANACTRYYTDFNDYPGPFSNDQIDTEKINNTTGVSTLTDATSGTLKSGCYVSMSQNLTLGLLGGLVVTASISSTTATYTNVFDYTTVGLGPLSQNPSNPRRYGAYITNYQNLLSSGQFTDAVGNKGTDATFTDVTATSAQQGIPVFVDRFVGNPLPILYLRARVGAPGIIAQLDADGTGTARLQYDLDQIIEYTGTPPTGQKTQIGNPSYKAVNGTTYKLHGLSGIGSFTGSVATNFPTTGANAGIYFMNTSATPTLAADPQDTGRPMQVDQFILISAGKDGTYGTSDDITNFGDITN